MADKKQTKPIEERMPLPDPDAVQRTFEAAVAKVKERRRFYTGLAILVLLAIVATIFAFNLRTASEAPPFAPLWARCEPVRRQLAINQTAASELAQLETYVDEIRGSPMEGLGLWFLGVYHYREAWLPDKLSFEDRKPHLEKALRYLGELKEERFWKEDLLVDKPRWFSAATSSPLDKLHAQVKTDLEWAEANSYKEPPTGDKVVAVLRTSAGDVHLQFFPELAPKLTNNFLTLAKLGTYNETAFHFIRGGNQDPTGVMGGDPLSFFYSDPLKKDHLLRWGQGSTGYEIPPEQARFDIDHRRGIVTSQMRDRADWNNGVQFMILVATDPSLDRRHTPFAKVVEGIGVVDKIAKAKTASQHDPYKDDYAFSGPAVRDLVVEPVILHKVIVFEGGQAVDHAFPIEDGEKSLSSLSSTAPKALPKDKVYCDRKLRKIDAEGPARLGLDFPFPLGIDEKQADPFGERREKPVADKEKDPPGKDEGEKKDEGGAKKKGDDKDDG